MMNMALAEERMAKDDITSIYQAFVETLKYGFAQRSHLGDMEGNPIKNITEKVTLEKHRVLKQNLQCTLALVL